MKDKKTKVIALCATRLHAEMQSALLNSIYQNASQLGYNVIAINAFNDMYYGDRSSVGESKIFNIINYNSIDGIIVLGETIKNNRVLYNIISNAERHNIPLVSIDKKLDYGYNILFGYANAMEQIVRHVVEHHKLTKINFIAGSKDNQFSEERLNTYKKVLMENNIPIEEERIGYGDFWFAPTQDVLEGFLNSKLPFPEAIICANDTMAMVTCEFLNNHGYKVPDDVIVTGFDGTVQERYHIPRLTTAKQDNDEAGKCAVKIIDDVIHGKNPPQDNVIPYHVVLAGSCNCVPTPSMNSNVLTMSLYNQLSGCKEFEGQMQEMISTLTDTQTPSEMISKLPAFVDILATTEFWLCVQENFFGLEQNNAMYEYNDDYGTLRVLVHKDHESYNDIPNFNVSEMIPNLLETLQRYDEHFILFSPLHFQEKTIGYIAIATDPCRFNFDNHLLFSQTLSNILEIVQAHGELKQAISKLEEMYVQDYLTGLMNRRGFYKSLNSKINQLGNCKDKEFMVISIDLNGLKYINDVFGHGEGDNAIKTVARCMASNAIKDEICARFGGDEFVVAGIIEKGSDYAEEYIKQFKSSISYYNKHSNKPYEVGASCGVYIGLPTKEADVDEMIKRADDIMYAEKSRTKYNRGR